MGILFLCHIRTTSTYIVLEYVCVEGALKKQNEKEEFAKIFSLNLRKSFHDAVKDFASLQEIRLRPESPMLFKFADGIRYLSKDKQLCSSPTDAYIVPVSEIRETMEYISNYSMYAYEEELKRGYLTISGGHRIGVAGKVNYENNEIRGMKYISFLCIRLAHEVIGCSDCILDDLFIESEFADTLILSPPGYGKTTLLRDLIRHLSNGCRQKTDGYQIGIVDERSEIAASYLGVPQNEIGIHSDVYDSCPKEVGIMYLLRSMSPQIIALDELTGRSDIEAIEKAFGCGCRILATTHAGSIKELQSKAQWNMLLEQRVFKRFIVIERAKPAPLYRVYDEYGQPLR